MLLGVVLVRWAQYEPSLNMAQLHVFFHQRQKTISKLHSPGRWGWPVTIPRNRSRSCEGVVSPRVCHRFPHGVSVSNVPYIRIITVGYIRYMVYTIFRHTHLFMAVAVSFDPSTRPSYPHMKRSFASNVLWHPMEPRHPSQPSFGPSQWMLQNMFSRV